jgi:hypothetical protein
MEYVAVRTFTMQEEDVCASGDAMYIGDCECRVTLGGHVVVVW